MEACTVGVGRISIGVTGVPVRYAALLKDKLHESEKLTEAVHLACQAVEDKLSGGGEYYGFFINFNELCCGEDEEDEDDEDKDGEDA